MLQQDLCSYKEVVFRDRRSPRDGVMDYCAQAGFVTLRSDFARGSQIPEERETVMLEQDL